MSARRRAGPGLREQQSSHGAADSRLLPRRKGPSKPPGARQRRRARSGLRGLILTGLAALAAWLLTSLSVLFVWAILPGAGKGTPILVSWPSGLDATGSAQELAKHGLIKSPWLFAWYLRVLRPTIDLEPGVHVLNDALSPRELVQRLGRLSSRGAVRVPLPEGLNLVQVAHRLEELQVCSDAEFQRIAREPSLLSELGIVGDSVEGHLFPAGYDLLLDSDPKAVVRTLVREMHKRLDRLVQKHPGSLERAGREFGFGRRELVILASIVEKETAHADERALIASVFYNRLTDPSFTPARMLQSDPTAAYGCIVDGKSVPSCAGYNGRVTPAMLRDAQNRYNTYKHAGLPPGPIANPGEAALLAVLLPAKTQFLFFVGRGDGRHTFSRTFEEHSQAIKNPLHPSPVPAP